jgi:hypothetical protein
VVEVSKTWDANSILTWFFAQENFVVKKVYNFQSLPSGTISVMYRLRLFFKNPFCGFV